MEIRDSNLGIFGEFSNVVLNNMTVNPFRFPRPENVVPVLMVGDHKVPNVSFENALKYVFDRCLKDLLVYFKRNMVETFEDLRGEDTVDINTFKCGNKKVSRNVYIGIWAFRCSLISKNPNLTVADIQNYVDYPQGFETNFRIVFETGEIRPKPNSSTPPRTFGNLERGNTRP